LEIFEEPEPNGDTETIDVYLSNATGYPVEAVYTFAGYDESATIYYYPDGYPEEEVVVQDGQTYTTDFPDGGGGTTGGSSGSISPAIPTISLGNDDLATSLAVNPSGTDIYVTGESAVTGDATVWVVDPANGTVTDTINVAAGTGTGVVVDPTNGDLYVTGEGVDPSTHTESSEVWVVDPANGTVTDTIDLPAGYSPVEEAVDPTNGEIFIVDSGASSSTGNATGELVEINPDTNGVTTVDLPAGYTPAGVAFDSTNGDLYVTENDVDATSDTDDGAFSVIDPATNAITTTDFNDEIGASESILSSPAVNPTNGDVYIPYISENATTDPPTAVEGVLEIDPATNAVTSVELGSDEEGGTAVGTYGLPSEVAVDPTSGDVYVTTEDTGGSDAITLSVIDPATNTVTPVTLGTDFTPAGLTVDPANGDVYAVDEDTDTVLKIPPGG
jgi:DNA-binding beta-propeller fold protein YncE